jgi:vitamin B12 transporter
MRAHSVRIAVALTLGTMAAAPLAAQQRDTLRTDTLSPVVVTGGWTPVQAANFPGAVSVINDARLQAEAAPLAIDLLRSLPGTHVDEAAGPGGPAIVRLRGGEEVFTQILLDGTPINDNGGFFDFQGFGLSNLERVEVARGPQSAVFGSSAVSGVVQFVTRAGTAGPLRTRASMEGGGASENGGS